MVGILVQGLVAICLEVVQIYRNGELSVEFQQRAARLPEEVTEFARCQPALALGDV